MSSHPDEIGYALLKLNGALTDLESLEFEDDEREFERLKEELASLNQRVENFKAGIVKTPHSFIVRVFPARLEPGVSLDLHVTIPAYSLNEAKEIFENMDLFNDYVEYNTHD